MSHNSSQEHYSKSEHEIEGNPWTVVPIKTRLYAKDTKEIVLSKRGISKLVSFEQFENLQALWLNNNKLKALNGLDCNFRISTLVLSNNIICTLEGSLSVMKFLRVLYLDNNKLRNLDKQINFLKALSFLENLNLTGNPLAEEPEYRSRVIYNLYSLKILDRHKITDDEKREADKIVPEFINPLLSLGPSVKKTHQSHSIAKRLNAQKEVKRKIKHSEKILMEISTRDLKNTASSQKARKSKVKVYDKQSITEKELFIEAKHIVAGRQKSLKDKDANEKMLLRTREYNATDMPCNIQIELNKKKLLKEDCHFCPEMETNDILRVFNLYDPSKYIFIYNISRNYRPNQKA